MPAACRTATPSKSRPHFHTIKWCMTPTSGACHQQAAVYTDQRCLGSQTKPCHKAANSLWRRGIQFAGNKLTLEGVCVNRKMDQGAGLVAARHTGVVVGHPTRHGQARLSRLARFQVAPSNPQAVSQCGFAGSCHCDTASQSKGDATADVNICRAREPGTG